MKSQTIRLKSKYSETEKSAYHKGFVHGVIWSFWVWLVCTLIGLIPMVAQ